MAASLSKDTANPPNTELTFEQREAEAIRKLLSKTVENMIEIGSRLIAVKRGLPHGEWLPYLRREFDWSESTARNFMNVSERLKSATVEDLRQIAPSALYLLAAPSTPVTTHKVILERAHAGERITHSDVKDAIEFAGIDAGELRRRDAAAIAAVKGEDGSQFQTDPEAKRNVLEMLAPIISPGANTITPEQQMEARREFRAFVREMREAARAKRLEFLPKYQSLTNNEKQDAIQGPPTLIDCKDQFINAAIALTDHPHFDESTLRWLGEFCEMLTNTLEHIALARTQE